ncbi:AfsR/SARP family transcriptional regulator [Flindersiella endophytica]
MLFRVLGPVEVDGTEAVNYIGARKPRTLLAVLLLNANVWVSVDQLVDAIWADQQAPISAERNVGTYIWQLRKLLPSLPGDGQRIESRSGAYRIRVEAGEVDTDRFEALLADGTEALAAGEPAIAVERLEAAAALWRGTPFEGLVTATDQPRIAWIVELHWTVRERLVDAFLAADRLPEAIALGASLTTEDPLRESAWVRLIVALRDAGRKADALAAYRRARAALVEELGIEPGPELQRLHQDLLTEGRPETRPALRPEQPERPEPGRPEAALEARPPTLPARQEPSEDYVRTALAAADVLTGRRPSSVFAELSAALSWFDAERTRLTGAIDALVTGGRAAGAWQLCSAAHEYTEAGGRLDNWPQLLPRVASATQAAGDRYGELVTRNILGVAYTRDGRVPEACAEFTSALGIAAAIGDRDAEGIVLINLAMAEADYGAPRDAAMHLQRALRVLEDPAAAETARQALAELEVEAGTERRQAVPATAAPGNEGDEGAPTQAAAPRLTTARGGPDKSRHPLAVPAQLPADTASFVGRESELAHLDTLTGSTADQPGTFTTLALSGTAGIGKTALAVRFAHRVAHRFPDGQLYVNLRGFEPTGQVMDPADAVRGFLDALGVPRGSGGRGIPAELDAQAALYRSLVTGKRLLVLLDNARDSEQIRPLLPGSPGCLVIATSRNDLGGLVTKEGARPLALDLLGPAEAGRLLEQRIGTERAAAEPDAVRAIVTACAGLPLALAVVAARAAAHPRFSLRSLADELKDARSSLDAFAGADADTDVRGVFSWSVRQLSVEAQRVFRLLGLYFGPDLSMPAVASLSGLPHKEVRPVLAELARAHLVVEQAPGRYGMHDLLRAYAGELADRTDPRDDRTAATYRLLDHYVHTAYRGNQLLDPHRDPIVLAPPREGAGPEQLQTDEQAAAWFSAEHSVLLDCLSAAADAGFHTHAWQLAWTLETFLYRRGHWHDLAAAGQTGLSAAQRLGDEQAQAKALLSLGVAEIRLDRVETAHTRFQQAFALFGGLGDHAGQALAHRTLGRVYARQKRYADALEHNQHALRLYRQAAHQPGQALALNAIGWYHAELGQHREALDYCTEALALQQELGDQDRAAYTWDSIGYAHHNLGQYPHAISSYQQALALYRDSGDRYYRAATLTHLGDSQHAAGDTAAAQATWQQALSILDELDHPDADDVRTKLRQPSTSPVDESDQPPSAVPAPR